MIQSLVAALVLVSTIGALQVVARRVALPSPFLLVPAGILLGFVPRFPQVTLDPQLVLYIFLPPLVYSASARSSWLEFRRNLGPIALLSVGCVVFTAAGVAAAAHAAVPGLGWGVAFVLGAVISPPDDLAAIVTARRLGIPKALSATLEGEGLLNDAAALILFRFAAAAVVTHAFAPAAAAGAFLSVLVGEVLWGVAVAWVLLRVRRRVRDTEIETCLAMITPFLAYLPPASLGGTGVLAAVAAGLYTNQVHSRLVPATTRLSVLSVLDIVEFLLDGILFLVAGMQFHRIAAPLAGWDRRLLWGYALGASALVVALRIFWVFGTSWVLRLFGRALRCEQRGANRRRLFIVSWSGMRGAISLAAALAIPLTTELGAPFPGRDLIVYLTFCVIVATLLFQGLSLPWLIRRLGIDKEGRGERHRDAHREIEARLRAAEASLEQLRARRREGAYPAQLLDRLEEQYVERSTQFRTHLAGDHSGAARRGEHRMNVQMELIEVEREAILRLRGEGFLDDAGLRRIEQDLDLQEMRLLQGVGEHAVPEDDGDVPEHP